MQTYIPHVTIFVWSSLVAVAAVDSVYLKKGHRSMNESIIASTSKAISLAQCSYRCMEESSQSLYFIKENRTCHCNNNLSNDANEGPDNPKLIYGYFYEKEETVQYKDCLELYEAGFTEDGVYTIFPDNRSAIDTWCNMTRGGWTVFQRRMDGSVNFTRGWSDYVTGFGNTDGEYWLGLDNIHALTTELDELVIDMEGIDNADTPKYTYSYYSVFKVDNQSLNYRIRWGGTTLTGCVDFIHINNWMSFTTFDSFYPDCADIYKGGWWYHSSCKSYNLNGQYDTDEGGITYTTCFTDTTLTKVSMSIRGDDFTFNQTAQFDCFQI